MAITKQRTMQDFAHQMRWLVDEAYPDVPVIRLVLDNLNTHRTASLYETFPPAYSIPDCDFSIALPHRSMAPTLSLGLCRNGSEVPSLSLFSTSVGFLQKQQTWPSAR